MQSITTAPIGSTVEDQAPGPRPAAAPSQSRRRAQRGQVLVLYVMSIFVILGLVGVVIDVSWYWTNSLRVQRAADAAALAGAVNLPKSPSSAVTDAVAEANKNGYSLTQHCAADGTSPFGVNNMCAYQDPGNVNQLDVAISAPVGTFFMRLFGIQTITATRASKALFTLQVPMGSPENYYGVFGPVRNATMTTTPAPTTTGTQTAGPVVATSAPGAANWNVTPVATPAKTLFFAVATAESSAPIYYAQTATNNTSQQWSGFGLQSVVPGPVTTGDPTKATTIKGLQVVLTDARISQACTGLPAANYDSTIGVEVSWDGGTTWSTKVTTGTAWGGPAALPNDATSGDYTIGNNNNTAPWGAHVWTRAGGSGDNFSDTNFRVRLTANKGPSCVAAVNIQVDQIQVTAYYTQTSTYAPVTTTATYQLTGPGSACANGVANCYKATPAGGGQTLNPRGFWATQNTQGAANVNGDAYQPFYDTPTSAAADTCPSAGNACYDPVNYYNYAIKMPPSTTGGEVYVFDPVFCATTLASGTGDRWFNGSNSVSSWYQLWQDTPNTPWDLTDDTQLTTSGSKFENIAASDSSMGGSGGSECKQMGDSTYGDGRDFHDSWYLLYSGLTGGSSGTTYRLHTTQSGAVNQKSTNGEQSFAIFADNAEGTTSNGLLPQVYGMGAMQMFSPLSATGGTTNSEFYLAQVPAYYAGKTLEINLWDPGDTQTLAATLYIEKPTSSGWATTPFTYSAKVGTSDSGANSACNSNSNSLPTNNSVKTNNGGSPAPKGLFNGCWLTLEIPIPTSYAADQNGWWKILYSMTGNDTSSDVTTWTAAVKGNPVHLVVP